MVELAELKAYTLQALEDRGVPFDRIVEVFQKLLDEDRSDLIRKGYNPDISKEQAARYLSIAFENRDLLQSALVGIELDFRAERGELREPLLSMIRADEPLMPVDETILIGALDRDAQLEFGHQDTHKVGIVKELDQAKNRVHTFMDDIVGAFVAQASSIYKREQEYQKKMKERQNFLNGLTPEEREEVERFIQEYHDSDSGDRSNIQFFHKFRSKIPILFPKKPPEELYPREILADIETERPFAIEPPAGNVKKYHKNNLRTSFVLKSAIDQMRKRGLNFRELGKVSFRMQKKYLDGLSLEKDVKPAQLKVVKDKRELHAVYLIAAELDRLFARRALSPMMQRLMEDRENFAPPSIIARAGSQLYGGIAETNFGRLKKSAHQEELFDIELLNWYRDPSRVFTPEVALMIIANTNGRLAHRFKDLADLRAELIKRMVKGANTARKAIGKIGKARDHVGNFQLRLANVANEVRAGVVGLRHVEREEDRMN